jgi:hypothetical protein
MSTGANLAFSFSQGGSAVDVSSVLQQDTLGSYWINSTDYKIQYNVLPGTSVKLLNLSINITGGQDPVGNPPTPYTGPASFSIDTLHTPPPLAQVKSITTNLETVTAANTMANGGADSF